MSYRAAHFTKPFMFKLVLYAFIFSVFFAIGNYVTFVSVAQAAIVDFNHSGFLQNNEGGYYGYENSVFDFTFELDDVGAEYANVYFCANFTSCDVVSSSIVPLTSGVGSASIDMSSVPLTYPFGAGYIAVVARDSGEGYLNEYSASSYFDGGFVLTITPSSTSTQQYIISDPNRDFTNGIWLFLAGFALIVLLFKGRR